MPTSNPAKGRQYWVSGRGFTPADPERRGEVVGYVRSSGIETTRAAAAKPAQSWTRVQPDVDSSGYEGGSSRRWR